MTSALVTRAGTGGDRDGPEGEAVSARDRAVGSAIAAISALDASGLLLERDLERCVVRVGRVAGYVDCSADLSTRELLDAIARISRLCEVASSALLDGGRIADKLDELGAA